MFEYATVPLHLSKVLQKPWNPDQNVASRAYWAHNNEEHLRLTLEFKRIYRFRMSMWHDALRRSRPCSIHESIKYPF